MYIFGIIGLLALSYGLYLRFSNRPKSFYLPGGSSVMTPTILRFIPIPLGITCITLELIAFPYFIQSQEVRRWLWICLVNPMLLISLILTIAPPRWLLPNWLNWLHDTYGIEEAQTMMSSIPLQKHGEWEKRVSTQEGLEAWAEEAWQQLQAEQGKNGRHP